MKVNYATSGFFKEFLDLLRVELGNMEGHPLQHMKRLGHRRIPIIVIS